MRALTLWQPWAQGVALGLKRVETRPRRMNYRGTLLAHAALKWTRDLREQALGFCKTHPEHRDAIGDPPRGVIVAAVRVTNCMEIDEDLPWTVTRQERAWGNWQVGRFAIYLEGLFVLPKPVAATGKQGLWIPRDDVLFKVMEQLP